MDAHSLYPNKVEDDDGDTPAELARPPFRPLSTPNDDAPLPSLINEADLHKLDESLDLMLAEAKEERLQAQSLWEERSKIEGAVLALCIYVCRPSVDSTILQGAQTSEGEQSVLNNGGNDETRNNTYVHSTFPLRPEQEREVPPSDPNYPKHQASIQKRQLGALLLKQVIRKRWLVLSTEEKLGVQDRLLQSYVRLPASIRGVITDIIALVAHYYGSASAWPSLLPTIRYDLTQCYEHHDETGLLGILHLMLCLANDRDPAELSRPSEPQQLGSSEETIGSEGENLSSVIPNLSSLCDDLLRLENGVQDALLHMTRGMKQFNFANQRKETTLPAVCRRRCLDVFRMCVVQVFRSASPLPPLNPSPTRVAVRSPVKSDRLEYIRHNIMSKFGEWMVIFDEIMTEIIQTPTDLESIKSGVAVLSCYKTFLTQITPAIPAFAHEISPQRMEKVLDQCLHILKEYYKFFDSMVINEADFFGKFEEDEEGGPSTFVMVFAEILYLMLGKRRFRGVVMTKTSEVILVLCLFSQVSEGQRAKWEHDLDQYVQVENPEGGVDTSFEGSIRASTETLIIKTLKVAPLEQAIREHVEAAAQLIKLAEQKKQQDPQSPWWKLLEASLWLVGVSLKQGVKPLLYSELVLQHIVLTIGSILSVATPDILQARALMTACRLRDYLVKHHPSDVEAMISLAARAAGDPRNTAPLRVAGCEALNAFLPVCQPSADNSRTLRKCDIWNQLLEILKATESEALVALVLDTIKTIFKSCPEYSLAGLEPLLSFLWRMSVAHSAVKQGFLELFVAGSWSSLLQSHLLSLCLPKIASTITSGVFENWSATMTSIPTELELDLILCVDVLTALVSHHPETQLPNEVLDVFISLEKFAVCCDSGAEDLILSLLVCCGWVLLKIAIQPPESKAYIRRILMMSSSLLSSLALSETTEKIDLRLSLTLRVLLGYFCDQISPTALQLFIQVLTRKSIESNSSPQLQTSLITTLCRLLLVPRLKLVDVFVGTEIQIGEGAVFDAFSSLVTLICAIYPQMGREPSSAYDRKVTYLCCAYLVKEELPRLQAIPTVQDVVSLLLRYLLFGLTRATLRWQRSGGDDPWTRSNDMDTCETSSLTSSDDLTSESHNVSEEAALYRDDSDTLSGAEREDEEEDDDKGTASLETEERPNDLLSSDDEEPLPSDSDENDMSFTEEKSSSMKPGDIWSEQKKPATHSTAYSKLFHTLYLQDPQLKSTPSLRLFLTRMFERVLPAHHPGLLLRQLDNPTLAGVEKQLRLNRARQPNASTSIDPPIQQQPFEGQQHQV